jgi:glutamate decarboxylase
MVLDANPALNLASFVTTWMEPEAEKLMKENLHKNYIDHDEYPQTELIQSRCVHMLADLFNIPEECHFMGTATIGSSEAIMLALLAHKWNWRKKRQATGLATDKPNVVFGTHVHVCWEKFARYFDVEMRAVPVCSEKYTLDPKELEKQLDKNTIAVGVIVGSTYTGDLDPLEEINTLLERIKKEKGWDIPMHVDGASGGFVLPFTNPDYKWDFRLSRVKSINVSGHKFGLVYPGVGWVVWRDKDEFPQELIYNVDYLGEWMPTYTLNFSRGSSSIIGQYYNFLRLGREGYYQVMQNCLKNAQHLSKGVEDFGIFKLLHGGETLPIVVFKLETQASFTVFDLSEKLRSRGWVVPAYTLPKNAEEIAVMRVVVRENFSRDMAELLLTHMKEAIEQLCKAKAPSAKREMGIC